MLNVQVNTPGQPSFTGVVIGCHPTQLGILFVKHDLTGETVACDGDHLVEVAKTVVPSVTKDIRGNWRVAQRHDLGGNKVLDIVTRKNVNGTFTTSATVAVLDGKFETHRVYQDFSTRLGTDRIRGTEKAVIGLHYGHLCAAFGTTTAKPAVEQLIAAVRAYYASEKA